MNTDTVKPRLIKSILSMGLVPVQYSGRSMYGSQCVGVAVGGDVSPVNFGAGLASKAFSASGSAYREVIETIQAADSDSMGLGTIFYWPSIAVEAGELPLDAAEADEPGFSIDVVIESEIQTLGAGGVVLSTGLAPVDGEEPEGWFRNHYKCTQCGHEWHDDWSAQCDDRCNDCGSTMTPYKSEDIEKD
ncbi:hypothetical protein A3709_19170 [Halioglobus sp. HI00S01]|uniref:hypothetical protein n=1 Tax=Halioglobus sp. HI00S01 TaxID=1822214 RepID=UPI0007C3AD09|nr:hypothetical protein [Halioglobus sp. HI00S01]KZX57746.1 hypothetical protein A3709_19170 [Halioglobus sp. HI00S01]